jgi:hypothetical protein
MLFPHDWYVRAGHAQPLQPAGPVEKDVPACPTQRPRMSGPTSPYAQSCRGEACLRLVQIRFSRCSNLATARRMMASESWVALAVLPPVCGLFTGGKTASATEMPNSGILDSTGRPQVKTIWFEVNLDSPGLAPPPYGRRSLRSAMACPLPTWGRVNTKVAPCPSSDSTQMRPPYRSTTR